MHQTLTSGSGSEISVD